MKNSKNKKYFVNCTKGIRSTLFVCIIGLIALATIGCYNVTYQMLETNETSVGETVKRFLAFGEVTKYANNGGQIVVPVDEDTTPDKSDSIENNYKYRIPTSVFLQPGAVLPSGQIIGPQGRLVISGDARWGKTNYGGGGDLAQKTSTWTRFSDDGGKTWSRMKLAVHYDDCDMSTFPTSNLAWGVVNADPTIGKTANNRLIMLSTFAPPKVGLHLNSSAGLGKMGDAYFQNDNNSGSWDPNKDWYLRLRINKKNYNFTDISGLEYMANGVRKTPTPADFSMSDWSVEQYNADSEEYIYYVNVKGGEIKKGTANGVAKENDQGTGFYVDENYFVYLDKDHKYPLYVTQLVQDVGDGGVKNQSGNGASVKLGTKDVHCHLFMAMSPFIAWRGCTYIGMAYSDDGGVTWSENKDITYMVRPKEKSGANTQFYFVSPCGGYLHDNLDPAMSDEDRQKYGDNKRLLFSAYSAKNGQESCVFWTDDEGETWSHATSGGGGSEYISCGGDMFSETTIVGHPSGALVAIARGIPVDYAISLDGGKTWKDNGRPPVEGLTTNSLMSATVLRYSSSPSGDPIVALSSGTSGSGTRANGKVHLLTMKADGTLEQGLGPVSASINAGAYLYSSVCELGDGSLAVIWETNDCDDLMLSFVEMLRE